MCLFRLDWREFGANKSEPAVQALLMGGWCSLWGNIEKEKQRKNAKIKKSERFWLQVFAKFRTF